jgi:hypothetical protein
MLPRLPAMAEQTQAPVDSQAVYCSNCTGAMTAAASYCPSCGQSTRAINRPWQTLLGELLSELFDLEGRMFHSLRLLMTRPGLLSLEFVQGRRASYTSPLRMYLVISLIFFFVLPLILPEPVNVSPDHEVSVDRYSQAMFVLLPLFGLLLKLFYPRTLYLNHLVFTVHLFSFLFIVFALMLSIETQADRYTVMIVIQALLLLYLLVYLAMAQHRFYGESWGRTLIKFIALQFLFMVLLTAAIEFTSHLGTASGG